MNIDLPLNLREDAYVLGGHLEGGKEDLKFVGVGLLQSDGICLGTIGFLVVELVVYDQLAGLSAAMEHDAVHVRRPSG